MTTPTMVYRAASETSDSARIIENEAGKWEWLIVELNDGQGPPEGWQPLPDVLENVEPIAPKAKRGKIKLPLEIDAVTEATDGNSDGN